MFVNHTASLRNGRLYGLGGHGFHCEFIAKRLIPVPRVNRIVKGFPLVSFKRLIDDLFHLAEDPWFKAIRKFLF